MKPILLAIILFISACTHVKDNWVVKAQDGKFYQLKQDACDEGYTLTEIDTANYFIRPNIKQ